MPHEEMTSLEVRIRRALLRRLLQGEPADLASLSTSTRLSPEEVAQALSKLNELGGIHVVDGALTAAHPCHFVHFFDSEESGARWTATHKGTFLLSLEEAFTLGQMTNARKFQGAL